jgi:hypothetical protein
MELQPIYDEVAEWDLLRHLDWQPEDRKSDSCETPVKECSGVPVWSATAVSQCPHDGFTLRLCQPCKDYEESVLNYQDDLYTAACNQCYPEIVPMTVTFRKI